ncbi:optic atrophy 3 protein homolog [Xenia sp. Carnegie-2017]|uniref:optic atrophy 3 protein homolog n=1 Tax=Xenia sp. Carnegie-2017 TaxID=2897299 RepID=UPI001F03FC9C|nr:optic atrophy 3 protein homolog [Xenia sp. Carnegie-2017]
MVAGLPLFKLASLAIKQAAKPVANVIKRGAKESDIFKKYLCYYPGQVYHRLDFHIRMRLMGLKGKIDVDPLKETAAVDLGAEILGEVVVFSIGVAVLYAEYRRQKRAESREEDKHLKNFHNLQTKVDELEMCLKHQNEEIEKVHRILNNIEDKLKTKNIKL